MGVIITFPQVRKLRLRDVKVYFYGVLAAREMVQAQASGSSVEWAGWVAFKGLCYPLVGCQMGRRSPL